MSRRVFRILILLLIMCWASTAMPAAQANESAPISGSYAVQSRADSGGPVQVALQIRLQSRGPRDLHIQRITLWDFSHPSKGASQPCSIFLHAGGSSNTTQEFTIPRAEYELWKRGSRPRIVLEVETANGHPSTVVVRLDRIAGGKATRP